MSRVDDDRQAERAAQRLLQEKQLAEAKSKQRREGEAAFSKLMQQSQAEQAQQPRQREEAKPTLAQSVLARALKDGSPTKQAAQQTKTFGESMQTAQSGEAQRMTQGRQTDATQGQQTATSRKQDQGVTQTRAEKREADSKTEGDATSDRNAAAKASGRPSKGELKTDVDSGGGQGGGNKDNKQGGESAAAAGFRFNPALMAPVPVAQPKPTAGSDRLRAIANEIAQKIVERVRVGTNGAGAAEFQIDLRSDVLKGLSIKLSAKNGKISAVFSGSDRDVLKMIEEQSEGLKSALNGRGLKLEDLRFEARA